MLSFSFDVKNELARIKLNDLADIIAELSAYIRMCGALQLSGDGIRVRFNTENALQSVEGFSLFERLLF